MNKLYFFICFLTCSITCWGHEAPVSNTNVMSCQGTDSLLVDLHFSIINNTHFIPKPHTPVRYPSVSQNATTLIFNYGCDNTTLAIVDDTDEIVYSIDIEAGCESLMLPSWLTGTFRLQIIRESFTFEAEIEL